MLNSLKRDSISIFDEDGKLVASDKLASVQGGNKIITSTGDFKVDVGYVIERKLPNGNVERYRVIEPNFQQKMFSFPAHYQMVVANVKSTSFNNTSSVVNNISLSDQARYYNQSSDNSANTYNTYTLNQYEQALEKVNSQVRELELSQSERDTIKKSLEKIEGELRKSTPSKDVLSTCISFLPASVATLESVINLGMMLGIS